MTSIHPFIWGLIVAGLILVVLVPLFLIRPNEPEEEPERLIRDCHDLTVLAEERLRVLRNVELTIPVISIKGMENLRFACQGFADYGGRRRQVSVYILPDPNNPERDTIGFLVQR